MTLRVAPILLVAVLLAPAARGDILPVPETIQEQNQWCWAATSAAVLAYYGTPLAQCTIADYTRTVCTWHDFGQVDCCADPSQGCNYWNYIFSIAGSIQDILAHWGVGSAPIYDILPLNTVDAEINVHGRPFIFRWQYPGYGHFLVGHGLEGTLMHYMDPWFGEGLKTGEYDWVVAGATHSWTHTLLTTTVPDCTGEADGTPCTDNDMCTTTDTCQGEVCVGADPVTCTALDQCHETGTCDPATGLCSEPVKPDGSDCVDAELCTENDTCQAGVCTTGTPIVCTALDQCHDPGVCDPGTGTCSDPVRPDGSDCVDAELCTENDTCQAGVCTTGTPVVCTALDQCHQSGVCDPGTGVCSDPPLADGTACDDSDSCTQTDTCQTGVCTGADPVVCTALDPCHDIGVCDPASGLCSNPEQPDGTACDDQDLCTLTDTCQTGVCAGADPVVCVALDQCHDAGVCESATGLCSDPAKPDGTACDDADSCTQTDACQLGVCVGADPVVCAALDPCHVAGVCDPATGVCPDPEAPDDTPCDDGNLCTRSDTCQAGTCIGADLVVCEALDDCHDAGGCDPGTGACSDPEKPNGTSCDDDDLCTLEDYCREGTCEGEEPVVCTQPDQCHEAGTCDPATGACVHPEVPDGTLCTDEDVCTQKDSCQGGTCTGDDPLDCDDEDDCTADSCDPEWGCRHTEIEDCGDPVCGCAASPRGGALAMLALFFFALKTRSGSVG